MFHGGSLPALGLDWIFVWVWFNLWAHGIEGRTHLVCAPSQTHFVEDSGSLLFFSLRCALKKSGKENQDTFFFFDSIKLSICHFLFKGAMCKDSSRFQ